MISQVSFTADGKTIEAPRGTSLLDALIAAGIHVPSLCHLRQLTPEGACRLCLVEVTEARGRKKVTTSCNYPVLPGIQVNTASAELHMARAMVIELLLSLAPASTELAEFAARYGVTKSPYRLRDGEKCIRCGLCIRVCKEVVAKEALAWHGRGDHRRVAVPLDEWPSSCIGCGACAAVCPTDAIHMEEEAMQRWVDRRGPERECRYSLMGITPGAVCSNSFQCWRCDVEHRLGRIAELHPVFLPSRQESSLCNTERERT